MTSASDTHRLPTGPRTERGLRPAVSSGLRCLRVAAAARTGPPVDPPVIWLVQRPSVVAWRTYFAEHEQFAVGAVGPVQPMAADERRALVRSLQRFQVGERSGSRITVDVWTSTAAFLDHDARQAITDYITEEHRHGDLLEALLQRMDAGISEHDPSAAAFTWVRRLLGLRAKVVVLNVAEIVGAAFYSAVVDHSTDATVRRVVTAIRDDELAHLAFGVVLIRRMVDAPGAPITRRIRRLALVAWLLLVMLAAVVVVCLDHAPYLRRCGYRSLLRSIVQRTRWFVGTTRCPRSNTQTR